MATRRRGSPSSSTQVAAMGLDPKDLLLALQRVRQGDFSARLRSDLTGLDGKIADTFNDIVAANLKLANELRRVGVVVGKEGRTRQRVSLDSSAGAWGEMEVSINTLMDDSIDWEEKIKRFTAALFGFIQKGTMLFIIREISRDPELLNERIKNKKRKHGILNFLETLQAEGKISDTDPRLLYIFLNAMCSFPVINRGMFQKSMRMTDKEYDAIMHNYAKSVADFFIQAIKKQH